MKAITIKQPWASLICTARQDNPQLGIKDIENRTWPTKFRGRVLVHASAKIWNEELLGLMTFDQVDKISEYGIREFFAGSRVTGAIIGSVEIVECVTNHTSMWAEKTETFLGSDIQFNRIYNWVLANPILFPEPIPAKGKLSFWDFPGILAEPEEKDGEMFCHCQIPVKEQNQVMNVIDHFTCRYCDGRWYK